MAELKEEIRNLLREELSLMKDEFKLRQTAVEQFPKKFVKMGTQRL